MADIEDLNRFGVLFETVRIDLPDAGKGVFEGDPVRVLDDVGVGLEPAACEISRDGDMHTRCPLARRQSSVKAILRLSSHR